MRDPSCVVTGAIAPQWLACSAPERPADRDMIWLARCPACRLKMGVVVSIEGAKPAVVDRLRQVAVEYDDSTLRSLLPA